jgi:hypothetical protein
VIVPSGSCVHVAYRALPKGPTKSGVALNALNSNFSLAGFVPPPPGVLYAIYAKYAPVVSDARMVYVPGAPESVTFFIPVISDEPALLDVRSSEYTVVALASSISLIFMLRL